MTHFPRRTFLAAAGSLAAGVAIHDLSTLSAEEPTVKPDPSADLPIVDTHQHLWNLQEQSLPWLKGNDGVLGRSYGLKEYRAAIEGTRIAQAVYMEVDVAPTEQAAEAERLIAICQKADAPTRAAVISGRPNSAGFAEYIRPFAKSPYIKGVRQVLHPPETPRGLCVEPQFVASMKLLGELGLSFDLCMRAGELADGAALAEKAPDTRFIVDHCGNADPVAFLPADRRPRAAEHKMEVWRRGLAQLADRKNVVCKISGIIARAPAGSDLPALLAPVVNHCLDIFGPDRVIFGSDWPVCLLGAPLAKWVSALRSIIANRPAAEQRKLLSENAVRMYGLKL